MNEGLISKSINERYTKKKKSIGLLIDPDKQDLGNLDKVIRFAIECRVDYFFVGGSLIVSQNLPLLIKKIKSMTHVPVILFPGNSMHIDVHADGILFLSLISGRNPDLLIGQHVLAAPILRKSDLEILPTGYMLVGEDLNTTVVYMSQTIPIPSNKPDIAVSTAIAGEMLGLKMIYLDAGSGARKPVDHNIVSRVKANLNIPLIVGGGLNTPEKARKALDSGADILIIGNGAEKSMDLLFDIADQVQQMNA